MSLPQPDSLYYIQAQSFRIAKEHGFWDGPEQDNFPTKIALIHEEVSEALKSFREGHKPAEVYYEYKTTERTEVVDLNVDTDGVTSIRPRIGGYRWHPIEEGKMHEVMLSLGYEAKPEGIGIELADAIIRICDLAERHGINLTEMIALKSAYNEGRPHMHGRRV